MDIDIDSSIIHSDLRESVIIKRISEYKNERKRQLKVQCLKSKIRTTNYLANTVEHFVTSIVSNDENFYSIQDSTNLEIIPDGNSNYPLYNSDITDNELIKWHEVYQHSSSRNTISQLVDPILQTTNLDQNAEHIWRSYSDRIVYRQDIVKRHLQLSAASPSGSAIIHEIRAPQLLKAPSLAIHQSSAAPRAVAIRVRRSISPLIQPSRIVNKYSPALLALPRRVIIE